MPIDYDMVLHCIIGAFETFGVNMSDDISGYYKSGSYNFSKLGTNEKIYYINYASNVMGKLISHVGDVNYLDIDTTNNHCLMLSVNKGKTFNYVTLARQKENDIIPEKIMKVCKYKKGDKTCDQFKESYNSLNNSIYKKIKTYEKYSDIPETVKQKKIYEPVCELVMETLQNEQKCAQKIFSYLFCPSKMIVLKLMQKRYVIYNFNVKQNVDSFEISADEESNKLKITFSNGAIFNLTLLSNSQEVKEHLSLKFHTKFHNINDIYLVDKGSIGFSMS